MQRSANISFNLFQVIGGSLKQQAARCRRFAQTIIDIFWFEQILFVLDERQ